MHLLKTLFSWLLPPPPLDPDIRKALERVCDIVDPLLKTLPGLEKKLAEPVRGALDYCERLVAGMPAPLQIDRAAFACDPLVHALFATADDIGHMLGRSQAICDYLDELTATDSEYIHAMLAARQHIKKTLGVAMEGEIVRNDVPMKYLYFADHTLVEPGTSLEKVRAHLCMVAFDSLLKSFRSHLIILRDERQALRDDRAAKCDQISVLRAQSADAALAEHTRHLSDLDARLRKCAEALQPEYIIDALAEFLRDPEKALRLEPTQITVDRAGIVSSEKALGQPGIDTLRFQQIIGRDRRRYLVLLVKFRRQDALDAIEAAKNMQHRYMII